MLLMFGPCVTSCGPLLPWMQWRFAATKFVWLR